jgi:uncharacterized phiE125 gp8 family phage protein
MATNYSLVEAPAPVVALEEMKDYLNVAHDDDDAMISRLIKTATETLDGPAGLLHRALGEQRWRLALDCFPNGGVKIGLPPVKSVEAITYLDTAGTEQTLPPEAYRLTGIGKAGLVTPTRGWPATADAPECITVSFTSGGDVPAPLAQLVCGLVWFWYEQRAIADEPNAMTKTTPFGFDDVVWNWRHDET